MGTVGNRSQELGRVEITTAKQFPNKVNSQTKTKAETKMEAAVSEIFAVKSSCMVDEDVIQEIDIPWNPLYVENKIENYVESLEQQLKENETQIGNHRDLLEESKTKCTNLSDSRTYLELKKIEKGEEEDDEVTKLQSEIQSNTDELTMKFQETMNMQVSLINKMQQATQTVETVWKSLKDELVGFKDLQKLAAIGSQMPPAKLEKMQKKCLGLTKFLQQMKLQYNEMKRLNQTMYIDASNLTQEVESNIEGNLKTIQRLIYEVLNESFIVVEQPPQVLKKNNRFSAAVHLMAGNVLNLPMDSPKVKVTIISEKQAAEILKKDDWTQKEYSCAAKDGIINSEAHLTQSQKDCSVVSCHFKNLQLKDFRREPRDSRSIHEQKFAILFSTEVKVGNDTWTLRSMSLPGIVTNVLIMCLLFF